MCSAMSVSSSFVVNRRCQSLERGIIRLTLKNELIKRAFYFTRCCRQILKSSKRVKSEHILALVVPAGYTSYHEKILKRLEVKSRQAHII